MAVTQVKDVNAYLTTKQNTAPKELSADWALLEEYHTKKLWHELTLKLGTFVKTNYFAQNKIELIDLYYNFLQGFENKINPLALVEIIACILPAFTVHEDAYKFLESLEPKVKSNTEAFSLIKVLEGNILLDKINNLEATKVIIDDVEKILDEFDGITSVHGRYYLLASKYYLNQLDSAGQFYYRATLRYLGCIDLHDLEPANKVQHAFFLGLAALLGEGVFNLGELLAHPILDSLIGTENAWMIDLLYAFNSGDINKFEAMRPKWGVSAVLVKNEIKLRQKISLLCLMEMAFKRASNKRDLTFNEIAQSAKLRINEVELLVMKALSEGLVRGSIDQVDSTVHVTWVQPRVLNKQQITSVVDRLNIWCKEVQDMETLLEEKGHDFLPL